MMLVDLKIHNSERADEILSAIAAKKREIDDLCFELRKCMALEAELKKRTATTMAALKINEAASSVEK